jgi:hypothetical protein
VILQLHGKNILVIVLMDGDCRRTTRPARKSIHVRRWTKVVVNTNVSGMVTTGHVIVMMDINWTLTDSPVPKSTHVTRRTMEDVNRTVPNMGK